MGEEELTHEVGANGERCEHGHHCNDGHSHSHTVAPLNELAIVGVITAVLFWPVGLVTSLMARREARRRGERGEGLALIGIFISALSGFFLTIVCVAVLAGGLGMGGPFRGHGEFGFVRQGTSMRVTPGAPITSGGTQCIAPSTINSGGTSITCTNGIYVNPGGPMVPAPSSKSATSSSGGPVTKGSSTWIVNTPMGWEALSGPGAVGAGVGAVAGSTR